MGDGLKSFPAKDIQMKRKFCLAMLHVVLRRDANDTFYYKNGGDGGDDGDDVTSFFLSCLNKAG